MRPKLDEVFLDLIICPICKNQLTHLNDIFICKSCGLQFMNSSSQIWNFILAYPSFLIQKEQNQWMNSQTSFEVREKAIAQEDDYDKYLEEIDSVQEIYNSEFSLNGMILDVGGRQGRLRHFLPKSAVYLSIDLFADVFSGLDQQPNLLRAYPCLREPCNFLQALAEHLPLQNSSFDYVHMRSVLDHFYDPYIALLEARRVLRPGGGLMVGLHVTGGDSSIREGLFQSLLARFRKKIRDEGIKKTISCTASGFLDTSFS